MNKKTPRRAYSNIFKLPIIPEETDIYEYQFPDVSLPKKLKLSSSADISQNIHSNNVYSYEVSNPISDHDVQKYIEEKFGDDSVLQTFISTQLFHKESAVYSDKQKDLFLKLYFKSPRGYKFLLDNKFKLPCIQTIFRWHSTLIFSPGLSASILHILATKANELSEINKKCILLFDELHIKDELEYAPKEDVIYGYLDDGEKREQFSGKTAMVMSLRGLNENWRQIIAYYIGSPASEKFPSILKNVIINVWHTGLNVVAVTCDQDSKNRSCYRLLGSTRDQPYFILNEKKVYTLFDIPHLFKSVRNSLLGGGKICIGNDKISWDVIVKLYKNDQSNLRMIHKLSDRHVYPDNFEKMSVKLATQIFSHKVATAISTALEIGVYTETEKPVASATHKFLSRMNNLFDVLNSKQRYNKNPNKNAISENGVLENYLKQAVEWILTWKNTKPQQPYCYNGLIQTINGILELWSTLKNTPEQKYLITSHFNQDPLENIFAVVRNNRGSYERNPSALRLARNLKLITFQQMIAPDNSGYEDSNSESLLSLSDMEKNNENYTQIFESEDLPDFEDFDDLFLNENEENFNELSIEKKIEKNALSYVAGYFTQKLKKKYNCESCYTFLVNKNYDLNDLSLSLIKNRLYNDESQLHVPSNNFRKIFENTYRLFNAYFDKNAASKNILVNFLELANHKNIWQFGCKQHESKSLKYLCICFIRFKIKLINKEKLNKKSSAKLRILKNK